MTISMSKPNPCIVSFGAGQWYPKGVDRLHKSLGDLPLVAFKEYQAGMLKHEEVPYAFKFWMLRHAWFTKRHHDWYVWVDSSGWLNDRGILEQLLADNKGCGVLFQRNGYPAYLQSPDRLLEKLGVDRDELKVYESGIQRDVMGGCIAVEAGEIDRFTAEMNRLAMSGCWIGDWKHCISDSQSPDYHFCRHEQAAMSVMMTMKEYNRGLWNGRKYRAVENSLMSVDVSRRDAAFLAQGM
jgi:hypothetical protein